MRSVSKTRNPAARASANLSRARTATSMPEQIAFGAAGSSGLRREGAACRRMTIAGDGAWRTRLLTRSHHRQEVHNGHEPLLLP
jgi:hypothetical protein